MNTKESMPELLGFLPELRVVMMRLLAYISDFALITLMIASWQFITDYNSGAVTEDMALKLAYTFSLWIPLYVGFSYIPRLLNRFRNTEWEAPIRNASIGIVVITTLIAGFLSPEATVGIIIWAILIVYDITRLIRRKRAKSSKDSEEGSE